MVTRSERVPRSGLASIAMMRSSRASARAMPSRVGDGGLADAALAGEHRHEAGAALELLAGCGASSSLRARTFGGVAEVHQRAGSPRRRTGSSRPPGAGASCGSTSISRSAVSIAAGSGCVGDARRGARSRRLYGPTSRRSSSAAGAAWPAASRRRGVRARPVASDDVDGRRRRRAAAGDDAGVDGDVVDRDGGLVLRALAHRRGQVDGDGQALRQRRRPGRRVGHSHDLRCDSSGCSVRGSACHRRASCACCCH